MLKWLSVVALLAVASPAWSQEAPVSGTVTSTTENSSLRYECDPPQGASLLCHFSEVLVMKDTPATPAQRQEQIQQMAANPLDAKDCDTLAASLEKARAGQLPNQNTAPEAMADLIGFLEAYQTVCANPSDEASLAVLLDTMAAKTAKSCKVANLSFDLSMSYNPATTRWESLSDANGPCGTVTAAYLQKDTSTPPPNFWNYGQRRLVTNTSGKDPFGQDCATISQAEQRYQWQQREIYPQCTYMTFGF